MKTQFWVMVASLVVAQGCASSESQLVCRHKAVACALVVGEQYGADTVRIADGPVVGDVLNHAQAMRYDGKNNVVWISNEDCKDALRDTFSPNRYFAVGEYVNIITTKSW